MTDRWSKIFAPVLVTDASSFTYVIDPVPPPRVEGKIEIRNFAFRVLETEVRVISGWTHVVISAEVIGRDSGALSRITFDKHFLTGTMRPEEAVRELLLRALVHEANECFFVDGIRVKDPHARGVDPLAELPPDEPAQHAPPVPA
jgi:hypothetical protein